MGIISPLQPINPFLKFQKGVLTLIKIRVNLKAEAFKLQEKTRGRRDQLEAR